MFNSKLLDEITAKLSQLMAQSPGKDFEKNARAVLASVFSRLDLVTREEFDVQSQVLLRTREKLEAMEKRIAELEQQAASEVHAPEVH
jgi:ubiquinone biosynthesis accessory factor UbiK